MASSKYSGCQTPFKDISNTTNNGSGPTTSNLQPDVIDPKESKRQRARDAYANMQQPQSLLQVTLLASFQLYFTTPFDVNLVYRHPK
jgi:hypothetical protein